MKLDFDERIAENYKSPSQHARVLTEHWVDSFAYCPNCGHTDIDKYPNNKPVADFYCSNCKEDYELKSKRNNIGTKIVDGAYGTMIERLQSSNNPNFFLLSYDLQSLSVRNFFVVPKHFFVPKIIERRKPLSKKADRSDWVGCNILLKGIPQKGKIFFVKNKQVKPKEEVLSAWRRTLFLREEKEISAKGWLLDIMRCIEKLDTHQFKLSDVYVFEDELSKLHPENRHIKDKIRQQLQILRDRGYIEFLGHGRYQLSVT